MAKKISKRETNRQLLQAISSLQEERKYMHSLAKSSVDTSGSAFYKQRLAEAKYLFLLREARHRKMTVLKL